MIGVVLFKNRVRVVGVTVLDGRVDRTGAVSLHGVVIGATAKDETDEALTGTPEGTEPAGLLEPTSGVDELCAATDDALDTASYEAFCEAYGELEPYGWAVGLDVGVTAAEEPATRAAELVQEAIGPEYGGVEYDGADDPLLTASAAEEEATCVIVCVAVAVTVSAGAW